MEYEIYNESLVHYTLRDPISERYLHDTVMQGPLGVGIEAADTKESISEIKALRDKVTQEDPNLKNLQIRKVKIIDIGEVYEEN